MKITCVDKEIKQILEGGFYKIPRFQRPYLWEKEQVEDFWNDTIAGTETDYFIGSMVVYKSGDAYGVVDGQQRMTTIAMILAAIRNALSEQREDNLAHGIHLLIERKDINNKSQFVLQTESSYPYFQEYIQKFGKPDDTIEPGDEEMRLQAAFSIVTGLVRDSINAINNDKTINAAKRPVAIQRRLVRIRDIILNLKLIFVELDNEDDAYIIFETLNTRGKDLSASDLVKNHLTRLLKPGNANVDLPKDKWNKIVSTLEESEEDLKINSFLHHFWLSRYDYTTEKKLFKSIRSDVKVANAKDFLKMLTDDVVTYREVQETSFKKWGKQELSLKASLDALNLFRVKQPLPMVLSIMREYRDGGLKQKHVADILRAIESFHFMFTAVTSQRSSGGISFMYALHARNLLAAKSLTDKLKCLNELKGKLRARIPVSQEFEANFSQISFTNQVTKQKKLVQYILARFDAHHASGVPVDYERMTIEHIGPQNAGGRPSVTGTRIGMLGNLILVDGALNAKLANKDFAAKKRLLASSKAWVDPYLSNASTWNNVAVDTRTKELAKTAYKTIWKI